MDENNLFNNLNNNEMINNYGGNNFNVSNKKKNKGNNKKNKVDKINTKEDKKHPKKIDYDEIKKVIGRLNNFIEQIKIASEPKVQNAKQKLNQNIDKMLMNAENIKQQKNISTEKDKKKKKNQNVNINKNNIIDVNENKKNKNKPQQKNKSLSKKSSSENRSKKLNDNDMKNYQINDLEMPQNENPNLKNNR